MSTIVSHLNQLARRAPATARTVGRQLAGSVRSRGATGTARSVLRYLGDAYREHGLVGTARVVLRDLEAAAPAEEPAPAAAPVEQAPTPEPVAPPPRSINWELRSQAELVDHIVQHHHARVREALPKLVAGARKVEREHAAHAAVPAGLHDVLSELAPELEGHMHREESMLFPALRTGVRGGADTDMPMRMMERDHDAHAEQMERIRELTNDFTPPADADDPWRELYAGLATFAAELQQHVYLENNILFARATTSAGAW